MMNTKGNYFFPDRSVLIFYTDYYGDERQFYVHSFPYKKKNKFQAAKMILDYCNVYYQKILRIEKHEYLGKKKGLKKIIIKF